MVAEAQLKVLGVGRVEKSQAHQTTWHLRERRDRSIGYDRIASASIEDRERIEFVYERSVAIERAILKYDRQIIDAIGARQTETGIRAVIDDDHSRKAHIDLATCVMVQMRMEPRG